MTSYFLQSVSSKSLRDMARVIYSALACSIQEDVRPPAPIFIDAICDRSFLFFLRTKAPDVLFPDDEAIQNL